MALLKFIVFLIEYNPFSWINAQHINLISKFHFSLASISLWTRLPCCAITCSLWRPEGNYHQSRSRTKENEDRGWWFEWTSFWREIQSKSYLTYTTCPHESRVIGPPSLVPAGVIGVPMVFSSVVFDSHPGSYSTSTGVNTTKPFDRWVGKEI